MLLAVGANASDPAIEPNPGVLVVTYFSEPFAWVFCAQFFPQSLVALLVELRVALILHDLADLFCGVPALINLLQQYTIYLLRFVRACLYELYSQIRS